MGFDYQILSQSLVGTAEAGIKWFIDNWGIPKKSISVESAFHPEIELRPTFVTTTADNHYLCIEVSETVYANHLNACVLNCLQRGLPVKFYVVVPQDKVDKDHQTNLRAAKNAGVGILEMNGDSGTVIQEALSLSLTAVRPIDKKAFPKKYRQSLSHAEQTFKNGAPEKACSLIYDEIESLFRKLVQKSFDIKWWPNGGTLDIQKSAWATLITNWDKHVQRGLMGCPLLSNTFAARMLGVTPYRNDSGHKPKDIKALIKRDRQLRTRFEDAVDLFLELVDGTKKLTL